MGTRQDKATSKEKRVNCLLVWRNLLKLRKGKSCAAETRFDSGIRAMDVVGISNEGVDEIFEGKTLFASKIVLSVHVNFKRKTIEVFAEAITLIG